MGYLRWAAISLLAYSLVAPFLKLATGVPSDVAVFISNAVVLVFAFGLVLHRNLAMGPYLTSPKIPYVIAIGILLAVSLLSFYYALSLGPVSVVVPIYGLFIVMSAIISVVALDERFTLYKVSGIGLAVLAIYLTSV